MPEVNSNLERFYAEKNTAAYGVGSNMLEGLILSTTGFSSGWDYLVTHSNFDQIVLNFEHTPKSATLVSQLEVFQFKF